MDEKRKSLVSKFSKLTQEARKEGVKLKTLREVFLETRKENNNAGKKNVESKKKVNTRKRVGVQQFHNGVNRCALQLIFSQRSS